MTKNLTSTSVYRSILYVLIIAGICLRLLQAISHIEMIYPDEHFQVLEPAHWVVTGIGWKSWEWVSGARSWFVPALYMPLIWILKQVGLLGGALSIEMCRAYTGFISGISMIGFYISLSERKLRSFAVLFGLTVFALLPAMIVWASSTFTETWATAVLWLVMPYVLASLETKSASKWFISGVLIGLTFLTRFQMFFWFFGIIICLLWQKQSLKLILRFFAGYFLIVLFQGFLDLFTWGSFLHSIITNIKMNTEMGIAAAHGVSPWYSYFPSILENLGIYFGITIGTLVIVAIVLKQKIILSKRDNLILIPACFFLMIHMLIPHKEIRFLVPIFPAFFYFMSILLNNILEGLEVKGIRLAKPNSAVALSGVLILTALSWYSVSYSKYYASSDISKLSQAIYEDGGLQNKSPSCIALINHYWVWTRGEMMLGRETKFIEMNFDNFVTDRLASCQYAIVVKGGGELFKSNVGDDWKEIAQNKWGHLLFKKITAQ